MGPTLRKIVTFAAVVFGGVFLYMGYRDGIQYLPAPELPKQLYRREHFEFAQTAQSPFFYIGLVLAGAGVFLQFVTKRQCADKTESSACKSSAEK